jgi:CTP:molybdopterin cytidylyltransferase MocA
MAQIERNSPTSLARRKKSSASANSKQPINPNEALVLDASTREVQQLVLGSIRNPNVTVCGGADSLQSADPASKWKVTFLGDRPTIKIEHADRSVKSADPNVIECHPRAPTDAIDAHPGESGHRR